MSVFLFLVVVGIALWIAHIASRTRHNDSLITQLTSRVFTLEQELKRLREVLERQPSEPQPARRLKKEAVAPQPSPPVTVHPVQTPQPPT